MLLVVKPLMVLVLILSFDQNVQIFLKFFLYFIKIFIFYVLLYNLWLFESFYFLAQFGEHVLQTQT